MKRVAFVISTLGEGGAQRILSNTVTNFPDDWEIDIILNDTKDIVFDYKGHLIDLGIRPVSDKQNVCYQGYVFLRRILKLKKLKKIRNYRAVISFMDSANIANVISGKRYCKTLLSVHCNLTAFRRNPVYRYIVTPLVKMFYRYGDVVVGVSEGVSLDLRKNYRIPSNKVVTIANGFDVAYIRKMSREPMEAAYNNILKEMPVLIAMGRLEEPKGFWHLIRALAKLREKVSNFKLFVLGEGSQRAYLERLTEELGLSQHVVFCGFCNNPFSFLAKAKALVVSSTHEGFSNVTAEALCLGVPVVSTDIDYGPREILAPDTDLEKRVKAELEIARCGILTPMCDDVMYDSKQPLTREEELLAEGMALMLSDEILYKKLKENIKGRAEELQVSRMVNKWLDLLE